MKRFALCSLVAGCVILASAFAAYAADDSGKCYGIRVGYGLAGPSVTYWSYEGGGSDTEIGVYLGGGVRAAFGDRGWYNLEARVGIGDVPDFRILLGVLFGGRQ